MKNSNRRFTLSALLLSLVAATSLNALAQEGPPAKIIVGFPAGGSFDAIARLVAEKAKNELNRPVVVDNKPGANGVVAAQAMAASPKDGYTFLVTDGSMFSINPALYKSISYDYKRDFVPVSLAAPGATITVNSLADAQANNGQCTLREALLNANSNNQSGSTDCAAGSGADTITFNIAGTISLTGRSG